MAYPVTHLTAGERQREPLSAPTPARELLAAEAFRRQETIAVGNLLEDPAYAGHLQVRERNVRAYVGTPIRVGLRSALAGPVVVDGREISISPALGADALLARVAAAAREGGGRAAPAAENASTKRRRRLLDDLRGIAERDELVLHVQPVVLVDGGTLCGVEALVRWQHPEFGLLLPATFIPLAEENETIVALGIWVLHSAARFARRLADGGHDLAVAVNVATAQLQDPAFIDRLRFATREAGVVPAALELEITETAALRDIAAATSVLSECRALGVRVALDDFGTGYSSLSYLRDLPSDIVKIDRSFVGALEQDPRATAIASATIVLAHRLGRVVQAEGVENDAQRAWFLDERCDRAQGFLYGEPVPTAEFERRIGA